MNNVLQAIKIKDPADRFDLSYAFANNYASLGQDKNPLVEMANIAKEIASGISARCCLAHPAEIGELVHLLRGSNVRPEVLIDFPDGLGGVETKDVQARTAKEAGAVGGDIVINLHAVQARDKNTLLKEFSAARAHLSEVKVISQIPYLWQYDKESIPWVLEVLAESGVYCIKDWTTRENFLLPDGESLNYSLETRFRYLDFISNYIASHNLPLITKVAGRVTADNVMDFLNHGVTLIGLSYRKASSMRKALLQV